jgi:prepilin peptidase CpaA
MSHFSLLSGAALLHVLAIALLAASAAADVMTRRIPNLLPALLAALGLVAAVLEHRLPIALAGATALLLVTGFCWLRDWIGGGDVKLIVAVCLVLPTARIPVFLLAMALAGGALSLIVLAARPWLRRRGRLVARPVAPARGLLRRVARAELWRIQRGAPLPYACAIAIGFVSALN